ncbi:MAG: putative toxin-antitoxin system toxin component, PIN family [Acidimicrobiales bacterium]
MSEPLRVVIDPNVWASGLINPYGAPADVVRAVMARWVIAVVTQHLIDELADVLARPKLRRWIALDDAAALVAALGREADLRPDPGPPPQRVRDPDDDYLVALAEATGSVIVTGDADLLKADLTPRAITPRGLIERLGWP